MTETTTNTEVPDAPPIRTLKAIIGFLATEPQPSETDKGVPKVYARYGVERYSHDRETGITTKLEPTFHSLVAYWETAQAIEQLFQKGDSFIAQGFVRVSETTGKERFEVKQIGHNSKRTRYTVNRAPRAGRQATAERLPELRARGDERSPARPSSPASVSR